MSTITRERTTPFSHLEGDELESELARFEKALGFPWKGTGAITSELWLRNHYGPKLLPTEQPEEIPFRVESNLQTVDFEGDTAGRYLYGFDANAMYLGASSSLLLPNGQVRHWKQWAEMPLPTVPGYWYLYGFDRWVTTPELLYMVEQGIAYPPTEGYYWGTNARLLEPWYKALRNARTRLMFPMADPAITEVMSTHRTPDTSPALAAVKATYAEGIGRLGSTQRTTPNDAGYQPYWRHAVIAQARTNLLRRIAKLSQKPLVIDIDALWFSTNARNPETFAKRIGLPLGYGIGQFKLKGARAGKAARELFATGDVFQVIRGLRG